MVEDALATWRAISEIVVTALALVAAAAALVQLRLSRQIRMRELEDIYVQRYWAITDELSPEARTAILLQRRLPATRRSSRDRQLMWRYLELCEDQADLRADGVFTRKTWRLWSPAIVAATTAQPYREVLDAVRARARREGDVREPLRRLRDAHDAAGLYDPARWSRRQPWSI
ncbi:hypothetical protein ABIB37_000795 [Agrococcus sp. UYP10]|uniref:hypothetical protein n=1 Tax=Agrococcus sp. UYP10 TaxID=1756355 RepID=UPI0033971002